MVCGVPNFAMALGYTNASWTLKCDLIAHYVCRLLNHMDERGYAIANPKPPDPSLPTEPFLDFNSGYVLRSIDKLPKQGATSPWRLHQNWFRDVRPPEARPGGRLDRVLGPGAASVSRCGRPRRDPGFRVGAWETPGGAFPPRPSRRRCAPAR